MTLRDELAFSKNLAKRHRASTIFELVCRISTWFGMITLLVLLISVAARVNHPGSISIFVDQIGGENPNEANLKAVENILTSHPLIDGIVRDVDKSGSISWFATVKEDRTNANGELIRYEDIRYELVDQCNELDDVALTLDSSEPIKGWDWGFLSRYPEPLEPEKAGILPGVWGSIWLVLLTALIAVPLGVGAAVYLEEYAGETLLSRIIKLNLANLAGVPSIVYGILGFAVFVRFFDLDKKVMIGSFQILPLGPTILTGAFTLALLILPVIIVATQEALRAIPQSIRRASIALGATKWQTIRHQVLPAGMPGIATGVILALSRALGETAPIVVIGVLSFTAATPGNIETPLDMTPSNLASVPFDQFTTIPIQIYNWVPKAQPEFAAQASRAILVLLVVLLCINSVAIYVRSRYQKNLKW